MNKFLIITNLVKDEQQKITYRIRHYLETKGKKCYFPEFDDQHWMIAKSIPEQIDCAVVIGGDGTLMRASRVLALAKIPILGVNLGTLGYLTEVEVQNIEAALDQLLLGDYSVEERMMLYGKVADGKREIALNDIVVSRKGSLRVVNLMLYVNGEFLNSYQADGIILSTPTGSTAYNLSAGGPIIEPTASMILVTPICSHSLNKASIVFSADDEVVIEMGSGRDDMKAEAGVSFDGSEQAVMHMKERLVVKQARETTRLIKLRNTSFLETLREKMKGK